MTDEPNTDATTDTTTPHTRTTQFEPGDLVVDMDMARDERGTAIVVRTLDIAAEAYTVDSLDATVAGLNPTYPTTDPVVEIMFEGHLDSHVVDWRPMLHDVRGNPELSLYELLVDYRDSWGVHLREYAYPASRLAPRPHCPDCHVRAEYDRDDGGYTCPVDDCSTLATTDTPLNADDEHPRPRDGWTRATVADKSMRGRGDD